MTLENEFTVSAIAELVRESCDEWYGDDTVLTDGVVEEFTKRLEKALDGKVLVEVGGAGETGPCEHKYEEFTVTGAEFTVIVCAKCGKRVAVGEGVG